MMIKADEARDLSIKNATKKFRKEIENAYRNGKFNTNIVCDSEHELLMYTILAHNNGYKYKKGWYGVWGEIEVMW